MPTAPVTLSTAGWSRLRRSVTTAIFVVATVTGVSIGIRAVDVSPVAPAVAIGQPAPPAGTPAAEPAVAQPAPVTPRPTVPAAGSIAGELGAAGGTESGARRGVGRDGSGNNRGRP